MTTFIPLIDARAQSRADALAAFVREAARTPAAPGVIADTRGRPLSDLRISVTDRCNFRCVYCMPKDVFGRDYPFLPHDALLTFEEITRMARVFVGLGVRKLRLTGGEPLLRRKVERLVEMLRGLSDDLDITLTTNGALLARKARDLRAAGLSRVTVSLDSLDDATFRAMNDVDFPVDKVLAGIDAAAAAGLAPLKINMVVKRGMNEDSIVPMARHFRGSGHIVRFIEYMDVGATNGWRMDDVVSAREIVSRIHAQMPLAAADPHYRGEVAERWAYADGSGEIGVIASVTQAFCRDCTRARLSTEGKVYTCLFADEGFDLRDIVRGGVRGEGPPQAANSAPFGGSAAATAASVGVVSDDEVLRRVISAIWRQRSDRYSEVRTANTARAPKVEMSYIGG